MSDILGTFACPKCNQTDFSFDPTRGEIVCNNCGYIISGRLQDLRTYAATASTIPPEALLASEEFKSSKLRLITLPHTHKEINKLSNDVVALKTDMAEVKATLNKIREESPVPVRVMEVKDMPIEEAKPMIENFLKKYLKEHETVYPSDVADELGLRYEVVRDVFDMLIKEEKLKRREEGD